MVRKEEFLSKAASGLLYTDELAQGFAEHYLLEGKAGPDFCRDMCLYASASVAQQAGERLMDVFQMWAEKENAPAERQLR